MSRADDGITVMIVPKGKGESRTLELPRRRIRLLKAGGWVAGFLLLALVTSWGFLAREALAARSLRARVAALQAEVALVEGLATQLEDLEARYERLRGVFSAGAEEKPPQLWLPPPGARSFPQAPPGEGGGITTWPLSETGFVTRTLLAQGEENHPGMDIAVPTGTYVLAAGAGTVLEVGEDPVYGQFIRIDHGGGLVSIYGHLSEQFAQPDGPVRAGQVIGLSGSTGRSTAPHLHFEIQQDGRPVDPQDFLQQP